MDSAGNAYIAGVAGSPDFPVTTGGNLATPPSTGTERSFAAKLNAGGDLVFSTLLGGSTDSFAQAIAVNASGQVLVSGMSEGTGFPSTAGVYSVRVYDLNSYLSESGAYGPAGLSMAGMVYVAR